MKFQRTCSFWGFLLILRAFQEVINSGHQEIQEASQGDLKDFLLVSGD